MYLRIVDAYSFTWWISFQRNLWTGPLIGIFHYPTNEEFYSIASFSNQQESHNLNIVQENYMKKRKRVLNDTCNIYKNPFRIESSSLHYHRGNFAQISSFQYFWFKDKYNMICSIQKAGSNSVHNFLRKVLQVSLNNGNQGI